MRLAHGLDELGGAIAGTHGSLDGCRQPRISPVSGKKQVFVRSNGARAQCILFRRRLERGAALADDLPWRQLAFNPRGLPDVGPDRMGEFLARPETFAMMLFQFFPPSRVTCRFPSSVPTQICPFCTGDSAMLMIVE